MSQYIREVLIYIILAISGRPIRDRLILARTFPYLDKHEVAAYQLDNLRKLIKHFNENQLINTDQQIYSGEKQQSVRSLLGDLPLTGRAELVSTYKKIADNQLPIKKGILKYTSGSSGRPVIIVKDNYGVACELAATWRSYEWAGVKLGDRSVRVWGRKTSFAQRLRQTFSNAALNRSRIDVSSLGGHSSIERLEKIQKKKPKYIYGYTSIIRELAQTASEKNFPIISSLVAIITTAEPLDDFSKSIIEKGFGVRCYNEYGCSEVGSIAHECEKGSLHVMADNLIVEVINKDGHSVVGEEGEIVITDLTNKSMPLIRYRLGDYGLLSTSLCTCGKVLPVLDYVYGRVIDLLVTPDGCFHHSAPVFYIVDELNSEFRCINQFQVVQESPSMFVLNIVPQNNAQVNFDLITARFNDLLKDRLHPDLEGMVDFVEHIDREASGKYRTIKRNFKI